MDLSFLIPSRVRRKVLAYFVEEPEAQVYVRELARLIEEPPQQVYRELINMENWGFLFSSKRGRQRVYRLNKKFPFYPPLRDLWKQLKIENSRQLNVSQVFDWKELEAQYDQVPVTPEMAEGLKKPRKRPRSYAEEKLLKKKGLL